MLTNMYITYISHTHTNIHLHLQIHLYSLIQLLAYVYVHIYDFVSNTYAHTYVSKCSFVLPQGGH